MAWADPATVTTGDLITAAQWNQDIVNNTDWLANTHWRAGMRHSNFQTITTGTLTQMDWDSTDYDFGGLASAVNNNFTIPTFPTGKTKALVAVKATLAWASNNTGDRFMSIDLNGIAVAAERKTANTFTDMHISTPDLEVVTNDVIDVSIFQDSGGDLPTRVADRDLLFTIRWVAWQD